MKKILLVLMAIMLLAQSAMAATLTVGGSASVAVPADGASVTLGVRAYGQDVLETQQSVNARINAVTEALLSMGIAKDHITTDTLYIYPYTNEDDEISGYSVSNGLTVVADDPDQMGEIIDTAIQAGANTMDLGSYTSDRSEEAYSDALALAVQDAQEKAEVIAKAAGLQITGIETIDETGYSYSSAPAKRSLYAEEVASDSATEVHSGALTVTASVTVVFQAGPLEE